MRTVSYVSRYKNANGVFRFTPPAGPIFVARRRWWASYRGVILRRNDLAEKSRRSRMLRDSRHSTRDVPSDANISAEFPARPTSPEFGIDVCETRRMMKKKPVNRLARVCHWNSGESNEAGGDERCENDRPDRETRLREVAASPN